VGFLSREIDPDLLISVANPRILKAQVLNVPRLGCINLHPSLLPSYRGPAPDFWVLACGENETGVTVHYMDEGIDTGEIILQSRLAIRPHDTPHSLRVRAMRLGANMLLDALDLIESGSVATTPNDGAQSSYQSLPTIEDARRLRKQGRRLP
jgi:methionyl-tRNA formyltransferase